MLDGCHRVRDLQPTYVAVDYLVLKKKHYTAFGDTLSLWWTK
jgi:hypothetical protein